MANNARITRRSGDHRQEAVPQTDGLGHRGGLRPLPGRQDRGFRQGERQGRGRRARSRARGAGRHGRRPARCYRHSAGGQSREVHSFGVRNLKNNQPLRAKDHMRIASVAKAFSGAVALSLVSKGLLSLNDTIGDLLPGLPKAWHAVTLRQLPNHTSGIRDFTESDELVAALLDSLKKAPTPRKLLSYAGKMLRFDPGSRYRYSNSDNIVVGLMIEAATDRSYESQLERQVLGPLGLTETTLPRGPNLSKPFIHGYSNDPSQQSPEDVSEDFAAGWSWASGGIVSTPADLNDFIRGYVGGKLFDRRTRAKQRRIVEGGSSDPPGPGKNSAGLAIFRYETRCGTVWGHTGNTFGYTPSLPPRAETGGAR